MRPGCCTYLRDLITLFAVERYLEFLEQEGAKSFTFPRLLACACAADFEGGFFGEQGEWNVGRSKFRMVRRLCTKMDSQYPARDLQVSGNSGTGGHSS